MNNSIFIYEFKHFYRSKAKFYSYITFMLLCIYSLINGYSIQEKQQKTINEIYKKQEKEIAKLLIGMIVIKVVLAIIPESI